MFYRYRSFSLGFWRQDKALIGLDVYAMVFFTTMKNRREVWSYIRCKSPELGYCPWHHGTKKSRGSVPRLFSVTT